MIKQTYSDKLQNPLWQKKRLVILNRDSFTCQLCGDQESTLHVHHKEYLPGREPWEYPDENFITYCKYCHKVAESIKNPKCQLIAVSKFFNESWGYHTITAISNVKDVGLVLEISRYHNNDVLETIIEIRRNSLLEMELLFQHCEKLTENGKRPSNAMVLE